MICVLCLVIAATEASADGWTVTAEEACVPDLRPAEDSVEPAAVFDAVETGTLALAVDENADGRGDLLLRLRPEAADQLELLRQLVAESEELRLHAWGSAAKTVELVQPSGPSIWLPVRTTNCRLPDGWVAGRELLMLESIAWLRTSDGSQLALDDAPTPALLSDIHQRMGFAEAAVCRAGGPGALSCGFSVGDGSCHAACSAPDTYACCAPAGCGCESQATDLVSGSNR